MARRLKIKWGGGDAVDALLEVPKPAGPVGVLLAHGAGAGQRHHFMERFRRELAAAGLVVMTFDYAYIQAGRRAPDRLPKLLGVHRAAADRLTEYVDGVALAGKSMGGRIGSHLVGDEGWAARGLVYLGYPLVLLGKSDPRPTDHLERIKVPQLFFAGTRDRLSPPQLLEPLVAGLSAARLEVVTDADHSFNVPKRSDATTSEVRAEIIATMAAWIGRLG